MFAVAFGCGSVQALCVHMMFSSGVAQCGCLRRVCFHWFFAFAHVVGIHLFGSCRARGFDRSRLVGHVHCCLFALHMPFVVDHCPVALRNVCLDVFHVCCVLLGGPLG